MKPLYITSSNKGLAFSSEIKGLMPYYKYLHLIDNKIEIEKMIDFNSINRYLQFFMVPW